MCVILGSQEMQRWLDQTPEIVVFAHLSDGSTFQSGGWQRYQWPAEV
jgi:hypothetical protein